jgi:hypothetical protein
MPEILSLAGPALATVAVFVMLVALAVNIVRGWRR